MFKLNLKTKDKKPLFTIKVYKRYILAFMLIVVLAIVGYAAYFRAYMTLPQAAINVLQPLPYDLSNQKVLVVSPHCDDEVLGTGGLIQKALAEKSTLEVVIGTNCNKRGIGVTREAESIQGLATLGVSSQEVKFWNLPESPDEEGVKANEDKFSILFASELKTFGPTLVILPHPNDTHVDHAMMGRVSGQVLKSTNSQAKVAYYLIHYNFFRYPSPSGLNPDAYLLPPAKLISPSNLWYQLPLSPEEESLKEDAILKYKSQLRLRNPVLSRILLDFVRKNELFMVSSN